MARLYEKMKLRHRLLSSALEMSRKYQSQALRNSDGNNNYSFSMVFGILKSALESNQNAAHAET